MSYNISDKKFSAKDYKPDCLIHKSTKSTIFKCYHVKTGMPVTIKIFTSKAHPFIVKNQIENEIKYVKESQDPKTTIKLIEIINVNLNDKSYQAIVYEYCEMDLRETIVTYRIQKYPNIYKRILKGCVKAVASIHQKNICHQDLKPRNFLLNNGCVKLSDFGNAKIVGEIDLERRNFTQAYCPPEIKAGSPIVECSADIWSLGITFLDLICGSGHFKTDYAYFDTHLYIGNFEKEDIEEYDKIPAPHYKNLKMMNDFYNEIWNLKDVLKDTFDVDDDLIDLISKMLIYSPSQRITISDILNHPYFQNLDDQICLPDPVDTEYVLLSF